MSTKPADLEPSKLGTREYWDNIYQTEIANHEHDPTDTGTAWFDDSDAEAKMLSYLEQDGRENLGLTKESTSFLDLGTGNGALLFGLRDSGWEGAMLGCDYSPLSVEFARRIERERRREQGEEQVQVHFTEHDILKSPSTTLLDSEKYSSPSISQGWDVVLDKGTFDAISLSAETLDSTTTSSPKTETNPTKNPKRINETYPSKILPLIRENGLFLITSCNWTEAELRDWFESDTSSSVQQEIPASEQEQYHHHDHDQDQDRHQEEEEEKEKGKTYYWGFEVVGRVEYRTFSFGGVKGQTISTLCFRKVRKEMRI